MDLSIVRSAPWGEALAAYVVVRDGATLDEAELLAFVARWEAELRGLALRSRDEEIDRDHLLLELEAIRYSMPAIEVAVQFSAGRGRCEIVPGKDATPPRAKFYLDDIEVAPGSWLVRVPGEPLSISAHEAFAAGHVPA